MTENAFRCAAIDLGTNSCRMIIVQQTQGQQFKILDAGSSPVYLGEKLAITEKLSEDSMQRSLVILENFVKRFHRWQPNKITAVATESFRRAQNGEQFAEKIRDKIKLDLQIISPRIELGYALLSCANLFETQKKYGLLADIGGGSLQIAWLKTSEIKNKSPKIIDTLSIPCGLAILKDQFGTGPIDDDTLQQIRQTIQPSIQEFDDKNSVSELIEQNDVSFVGASGVLTSITCIQYGYERYNRKQIDGETLNIPSACHVANKLRQLDRQQRALYGCVGAARADMLAVGCAIVTCLFELFATNSIAIADRGLREGIIAEMLLANDE